MSCTTAWRSAEDTLPRVLLLLLLLAAACSSREDRARQAAQFQQSRDSLQSGEVVKALQPPAAVGRLIYDRPADLSYDSLLVKRPELARASDRRKP
jgi:hypothetical protein